MGRVEWSAALELPNETINAQHKKLIALLNDVHDAAAEQRGGDTVANALVFLVTYVAEHFASEEELMREAGYPDRERHLAQHHALYQAVEDRTRAYINAGSRDIDDLLTFLNDWVVNHIMSSDVELARYLAEPH